MLLLVAMANVMEFGKAQGGSLPSIWGFIVDSSGNDLPQGVEVIITDLTKNTNMTTLTVYDDNTGRNCYYQADLSNLENCEDGDTIEVYCSYNNEDNSINFVLDAQMMSIAVNLSLVGMPHVLTQDATDVRGSSANIHGELVYLNDTTCQVWFEYGETTSYGYTTTKQTFNSPTAFSASIFALKPDKTYHFRAVAKNSRKKVYGEDNTFHTSSVLPQVTTNDASNIGYDSAKLNGYLTKVGASSCDVWFVYDTTPHTNWQDYNYSTIHNQKSSPTPFSYTISSLSVNTTYYFRAVASNDAGTVAGDEKMFMTQIILPTVSTLNAENITSDSAILKGELLNLGGAESCQVWFEYGETTSYGYTTAISSLNELGEFNAYICNLNPGETYHFRAVVKNSKGTSYGSDETFNTLAIKAEVDTASVEYAVILKGNLTNMGGDETCQVWFEYWEENGSINYTSMEVINGEGMFECVLTGLKENTTYYYRAVVNNSQGISYGTNLSFKMLSLPRAPTVETLDANLSYPNATLYANVTSLGDSTFCYTWFEYWNGEKHSTPVNIIGKGEFNASIEVEDGKTYYYRAIAVGSNGRIAYGDVKNFSVPTKQNHEPVVTLISPENNSTVGIDISLMAQVYDEDNDSINATFYLNGSAIHSVISQNGVISVALHLSYGKDYTWYVVVSDGKNESISGIYTFSTIEQTKVNFTHSFIFENEIAYFNDTSLGNIMQRLWIFGDGNISNQKNATHIYKKAGKYIVNLTITDAYGNTFSKEEEIIVWDRGDANMDGNINALDITKIERIIDGIDEKTIPADANGDGYVDSADLYMVINKILGLA